MSTTTPTTSGGTATSMGIIHCLWSVVQRPQVPFWNT